VEEEALKRERVLAGIANQIAGARLNGLSRKKDGKSMKLAGLYRKELEKTRRLMEKLEARITALERKKRKWQ
jgi:hypothetical protein